MNKNKKRRELFPIHYNGKSYYEKDCDSIFLSFYFTRNALDIENSVYIAEGMRVFPDGEMIEA